jgi:hypothetical protein
MQFEVGQALALEVGGKITRKGVVKKVYRDGSCSVEFSKGVTLRFTSLGAEWGSTGSWNPNRRQVIEWDDAMEPKMIVNQKRGKLSRQLQEIRRYSAQNFRDEGLDDAIEHLGRLLRLCSDKG